MMALSVVAGPGALDPSGAEDLVVATPERVAFRFETAGLGSRFAAQVIDLLVLWGVLLALGAVAFGVAVLLEQPTVAALAVLVAGFATFWGYWILQEALWSGQTLGKRVMHLRVVDARGGPVSAGQAVVRNLLRIIDFLPVYYAVGTATIFISSRNQRLGDLAAGTVVVRERMAVRLADLAAAPDVRAEAGASRPSAAAPRPAAAVRSRSRLDPRLRRFVVAYAQRRPELALAHREHLAAEVEAALRAALPDVVRTQGALAALDRLADEEQA